MNEEIWKKFRKVYQSNIHGDETSDSAYIVLEPITVQEMCDYILTTKEWGYIGIKQGDWFPFGNPKIEYMEGYYCDENRRPIEMNFPQHILKSQIKKMYWSGGWSRGDWLFEI